MIKFLVIGDVHFKVTNISEVEIFIAKIEELALSIKPDFIVILGDVLDTHEKIHSIPLNKAVEFFDKMRNISYTYILVGNHDLINNQQFLTDNHWMNSFKYWRNIEIVDKVVDCIVKEDTYLFLPYVPPGRFVEALNTYENWKNCKCIFAHQEFRGCKMGAIISQEGDIWDKEYPLVISGHIHSKDKLQDNLYYTGSAMQHAFGESTKNIVAIITFTDNFIYEEIDLNLPRKRIITLSIKKAMDYTITNTIDKLQLSLKGDYEEFKTFKKSKKYREFTSKGIKIKFNTKIIDKKKSVNTKVSNFSVILKDLIENEYDNHLTAIYENIILNLNTDPESIMYY